MIFGWNLNGVTPNRGTNCRWGRWKLETFDKQLTIFCTRYNVDKWFLLKLIHTALQDTTKLTCLCYVRFGGMNWIPNNSRLSPIELEVWTRSEQSSNSRRHTRHNTDRTILSYLVWRCELSRPDRRQVCSALKCDGQRSVSTGHTHTLRRKMHFSGGQAAPDMTRLSRLPVDRRRDPGQAGSYA